MNKKIRLLIGSIFATFTLTAGSLGFAAAVQPETTCPQGSQVQGNKCKVTICHRTDSVTNPYIKETVAVSAADKDNANDQGVGDHFAEHNEQRVPTTQAEAQAFKDNGQKWGDIIPPVTGVEPGLNWTSAAQAIYNNGCNYVTGGQGGGENTPPPTPTTTTTKPAGGVGGAATQVTQTPQGGVGAGEGGGSVAYSTASIAGLSGSIIALGSGLAWLNRRKSLLS